jgi:hypothetical protein
MFSPFRPRIAVFLGVGLLLTAQSGPASAQLPAQRPREARAFAGPVVMVQPGGTIEAIRPGFLQIKSLTGQQSVIQLLENTTVHVTGTAKVDVITPGTCISFVAEVDKRRSEVQGKVGRLTIFTPSAERPLGAFPGGAAGTALRADPFVETFEIVGQIKGIDKNGKLMLFVPNQYFKPAVEIEFTEEPQIYLELTGPAMLRFVKPGDKVQGRGRQVTPTLAQVTELFVELAEPLTTVKSKEPKKKPTRRTTRSSRRKRGEPEQPAETEEAAEPEKKSEAEPEPKDEKEEKEDK